MEFMADIPSLGVNHGIVELPYDIGVTAPRQCGVAAQGAFAQTLMRAA